MSDPVRLIYLDNAATTPVAPEVVDAMLPFYSEGYGNASSLHAAGRHARRAVEHARDELARRLGFQSEEIVFTSGATEADNLALIGLFLAHPHKRRIVTCAVEHHAVLHAASFLERQGAHVTVLPVDSVGRVDPEAVASALTDDTLVVSIMAGSNEIGTVQPIAEIASACRSRGVPFHTDAVQAFGKIPLSTDDVDLLSLSAHKFHGPKGVGLLAVRKGVRLRPVVHGGGHEGGLRSGTENVPGIVGMSTAAAIAVDSMPETAARMERLRQRIVDAVREIPGSRHNGDPENSLPHIVNASFAGIEGESLVMRLDERGVAASTGSACSSPELEASHVLRAIGVPLSMAHGSLRLSLGRQTSEAEIDEALRVLPEVIDDLRKISPFKVGD